MLRQAANNSRRLLDFTPRVCNGASLRTVDWCTSAAVSRDAHSGSLDFFASMFHRGFATKKAAKSQAPAGPGPANTAAADHEQPETSEVSAPDVKTLQAIIDEQRATAQKQQALVAQMKDSMLKTLVDMENLRERTARQIESNKQFAIKGFAKDLIDVADSLERAVDAVPKSIFPREPGPAPIPLQYLANLLEGVLLTNKQLQRVFKDSGVTKFESLGQPFDPNLHNALFEISDPSSEPGVVGIETKAGYMLNDNVLRAADVGVVKKE